MSDLYLVAHIAGRGVAIDTAEVDSVVDIGAVVPVPGAAPAIRGLAALRSRVVTVVDTRIALGLPAATVPSSRAVITRADGHHYAILVDSLEDVAPFERLPLPGEFAAPSGWGRVGRGMIERDGEPLLVVALAALAPGAPTVAA